MSIQYGYYLPLGPVFESVRFINIAPKMEGQSKEERENGKEAIQKKDKDGNLTWTISAIVKLPGASVETEVFTLVAPQKTADEIAKIPEMTPITLRGLAGGKWSKSDSDKTSWTFQITAIAVL
jgi:hypothetical protein